MKEAGKELPRVHMILKNRLTQYMGPASAYATVLSAIDKDVKSLLQTHPDIFTFTKLEEGLGNVRDFQTTGVVAHARGCPIYSLRAGKLDVLGRRVQIKEEYRKNCIDNIQQIVSEIFERDLN